MTLRLRTRRLYSLLAFIALISAVFLCFQLFSFKLLNLHVDGTVKAYDAWGAGVKKGEEEVVGRERGSHAGDLHVQRSDDDDECSHGDCLKKPDMEEDYHQHDDLDVARLDLGARQSTKLPASRKDNNILDGARMAVSAQPKKGGLVIAKGDNMNEQHEDVLLGVLHSDSHLYKPDADGLFTCVSTMVKIPFSRVNDDYCDCADSSDEPGTDACPDGRFFCTFQLWHGPPKVVASSRVNDGVCDCCDGSDEWRGRAPAADVRLPGDGLHYGVRQAPCGDHCQLLRTQDKARLELRQKGAVLKREYLKAAQGRGDHKKYGPGGVFYRLSQTCIERKADKYEYTLCPFREIKQQAFPQPAKVIGRQGSWLDKDQDGHFRLLMNQGDSQQCPDQKKRLSVIVFECGLSDSILQVRETEVCEYTVRVSTPAAC